VSGFLGGGVGEEIYHLCVFVRNGMALEGSGGTYDVDTLSLSRNAIQHLSHIFEVQHGHRYPRSTLFDIGEWSSSGLAYLLDVERDAVVFG
jgi:hypothetical protein